MKKKETTKKEKIRYYIEQCYKIEVKLAHSTVFTGVVKTKYKKSLVLTTNTGEVLLNKDYVVWIKRINNGKKKRA